MKNIFESSKASLEETANFFKELANTSIPPKLERETHYKEKEIYTTEDILKKFIEKYDLNDQIIEFMIEIQETTKTDYDDYPTVWDMISDLETEKYRSILQNR
ncbi:hypothetical protein CJ467_20745 [Bacillus velezensis]|nr:hypothetical protein CJ467_20745 [Bacillus velezensis]